MNDAIRLQSETAFPTELPPVSEGMSAQSVNAAAAQKQPRNMVEFRARGGSKNTAKRIYRDYSARKVKDTQKTMFETLLSRGERAVDDVITDAKKVYGAGVESYIPPRDLFRDPKTGKMDLVNWMKSAHVGMKKYGEKVGLESASSKKQFDKEQAEAKSTKGRQAVQTMADELPATATEEEALRGGFGTPEWGTGAASSQDVKDVASGFESMSNVNRAKFESMSNVNRAKRDAFVRVNQKNTEALKIFNSLEQKQNAVFRQLQYHRAEIEKLEKTKPVVGQIDVRLDEQKREDDFKIKEIDKKIAAIKNKTIPPLEKNLDKYVLASEKLIRDPNTKFNDLLESVGIDIRKAHEMEMAFKGSSMNVSTNPAGPNAPLGQHGPTLPSEEPVQQTQIDPRYQEAYDAAINIKPGHPDYQKAQQTLAKVRAKYPSLSL